MECGKQDPFRMRSNRNMANKKYIGVTRTASRYEKLFTRLCLPVNTKRYSLE